MKLRILLLKTFDGRQDIVRLIGVFDAFEFDIEGLIQEMIKEDRQKVKGFESAYLKRNKFEIKEIELNKTQDKIL